MMTSSASIQTLSANEIHIWMMDPQKITPTQQINALLSDSEQQKVQRYRSDKAKHTALITRSFIRLLLSQYAPLAAQNWQFEISDLGKPELLNAPLPLRFNVSHNDQLIICALCLNNDIGCDIENLSRKISVEAIAKRFFSSAEHQAIMQQPTHLQSTRFFEYWTLKEALVKATGLGISQGLDTFSFEISASEQPNKQRLNDAISLSFASNSPLQPPQHWYKALIYPDQTHCIGLAFKQKKQTDSNPKIHLFSIEQGLALY